MLLLILPLLFAGCTTAPSSIDARTTKMLAPKLVGYTKETQQKAALEMETKCSEVPTLCEMTTDYGRLRDSVRALSGKPVDTTR